MRLTVALTNGNKELPRGPAPQKEREEVAASASVRPDTAQGGGLAT